MVSILIPFKDTASYLRECLDSIVEQSYTDWEVIAVNDDSGDESRQIVEHYATKDPRFKVLDNSGSGIIPALRTAYQNCQGDFITRMDSDDIMKPSRLQVMVQALQKSGSAHISIGQVRYFSARGISNGYKRYEAWLNRLTANGTNYSEIYKECVVPSPCWMVYRDDFERCGAFEPDRYPEDYDLTFRFYQFGLKPIPCTEILHLWRDYDTRTSRTHEHYAQNYFLDIKIHYFLALDHIKDRPLVVWGAGFKGKKIAKTLIAKAIPFTWLCDNPNKIHKKIYDQKLYHFSTMEKLQHPQSIVTVANEAAQKEIILYLESLGQQVMSDYFFFC